MNMLEEAGNGVNILTYWGVTNYGAFAQAYALNMAIRKVDERDIKHLCYLNNAHRAMYSPFSNIVSKRQFDSLILKQAVESAAQNYIFQKAWNKITHSKRITENMIHKINFETIISGSDAIWEFSIPQTADPILIGDGLRCKKLISYAASFGNMRLEYNFKSFIKEGLLKYDAISVRDENSQKIIKKLIGLEVPLVLDPVFLYNFEKDRNIIKSKYKDYILVYGIHFDSKRLREVVRFSKKNKMKIISVGFRLSWADINLVNISPFEWIGLFESATYVYTSTFHGLMFAIKNKKPLVFDMVPYVKNRSETLLNQLELRELFENNSVLQLYSRDWNYTTIDSKLKRLQNISMDYLKENLK